MLVWLCYAGSMAWAQTGSPILNTRIALKLEATHLSVVLEALQKQCNAAFSFDKAETGNIKLEKISWENISLKQSLEELRQRTGLTYQVIGDNIAFRLEAKPARPKEHGPGKVSGQIIDEQSGEPIIGATIKMNGQSFVGNVDGSFTVVLPKGIYVAEISAVGYGTKQVEEIIVKENTLFTLNLALKREKGQLAGVMVKSNAGRESVNALYVRQKNAAGITDGISAEQISRTPDKNIAETLKRISGLSSIDNKYVVVRGLSERYNQAMLNGQMMPSTELNRKNFSYDIIPANLVDNVIVMKTLTPDQSAEFGGGLVEVNTKDIPSENFLSLTIGSTYNDNTTGKNFRSLDIEGKQYFGGIPDHRKLFGSKDWTSTADILNAGKTIPGGTLKNAADFSNNWGLKNYTAAPGYNGQISLGRVIRLKKEQQLGIIASASYRTTWQTQDVRMSRDGYAGLDVQEEKAGFAGKRYGFSTNMGGLAGIGYRNKRHKISLQSLYLNTVDQQLVLGTGISAHDVIGSNALGYYDLFTATKLWQNHLRSEHAIGHKGIKLNLALSYTYLDRQKPDNHQANMKYVGVGKDDPSDPANGADYSVSQIMSNGIDAGGLRWWSRALEKNLGWNADLSVPFRFAVGKLPVTNVLKGGYAGWHKDRLFWVMLSGSKNFGGEPAPLSQVFDPATGGGSIYLSSFKDDFHKKPNLQAGYLMMDSKIGNQLRLVWGARAEHYNLNGVNTIMEQFVKTQQTNNGDLTDYSELFNREPDWNFFPSANLTYSVTPKMNIRLAYSKSIIRPDLRELAFFKEYDFELGGNYWSQSPILSTRISHIDLRYEWYPAAGEVFSFSLFYKKLLYPMEIFAMQNKLFELRNDKDAINKGIEVEMRKSLAFTGVPVLKNITLYGNFTRLFSKVRTMTVDYEGQDASNPNKLFVIEKVAEAENRPQAGASNYMYNAGLYYDAKAFSLSLSYNQISNRFYRVGTPETGSLYEQPMKPLDLQLAVKVLKEKGTVKLNLGNLLGSKYIVYNNVYEGGSFYPLDGRTPSAKELLYQKGQDLIDYEAAPGRTYSLSFSYNF
jgi:hypothetical protein